MVKLFHFLIRMDLDCIPHCVSNDVNNTRIIYFMYNIPI